MKHLFLIRHAKSDWSVSGQKDFDRTLNDRGRKAAPEMGKRLSAKKIIPDAIFSSPAKRAISTAEKIAEEVGFNPSDIIRAETVYEADIRDLLKVVNAFPDSKNIIFLVGHNPGMTDFCNYLTGSEIANIPTCGVVHISFSGLSWKEVSAGTGELVEFDYPKKNRNEN